MKRTKWTERKFSFDFPAGWLPDILERLYGTTARLKEMTTGLSEPEAGEKRGDQWSIKEHIGHLSDLEELHDNRIDELVARKENLSPADMSNAKTNQANHNQQCLTQLINQFAVKRNAFIAKIEDLDEETQYFSSMHPRLQVKMRPVDVAFFCAEHDDHHLASIRKILKQSK